MVVVGLGWKGWGVDWRGLWGDGWEGFICLLLKGMR